MSTHRATAYLIVKAERSRWSDVSADTGLRRVDSIKVVGSRQSRPQKLERDEIAVKVTIEVPDVVFSPITPSALVVVPSDMAMRGPIGVEAEDASEESR